MARSVPEKKAAEAPSERRTRESRRTAPARLMGRGSWAADPPSPWGRKKGMSSDPPPSDPTSATHPTGRVDDVLNVSGHRLGTAEIESALVAHPDCVEAAVVGFPHDIKGQGVYVYIVLQPAPERCPFFSEQVYRTGRNS